MEIIRIIAFFAAIIIGGFALALLVFAWMAFTDYCRNVCDSIKRRIDVLIWGEEIVSKLESEESYMRLQMERFVD